MSELCLPNTPKNQLVALFFSDFILFCSFIFSHPLYFSYFIFFSPYLIKLLSFLSPLFITTSLLLFSLITIHHSSFPLNFSASKQSFFLFVYHTITEKLPKKDEEEEDFKVFEEFEVYKIVFDTSSFELIENCSEEEKPSEVSEAKSSNSPEEMPLETFFKELDDFEKLPCKTEEKKSNNVVANDDEFVDKLCDTTSKFANIQRIASTAESNLGAYGSMRKEKEWKRTLACKLFEERHNVGGDEGMDSLWETYESDSSKGKQKKNSKKKYHQSKSGTELFGEKESEFNYDEDLDEDEEKNVQLCCLQALKFSTGKMNLGMGRPNLVKFSKALKGIGWLHHVSKNSKKR